MTVIGQTQGSLGSADEGSGGVSEPPEQVGENSGGLSEPPGLIGENVGIQNNNTINIRNISPPPGYPCSEACIACGKKASEATVEGDTNATTTEALNSCSCECHKQIFHPAGEATLASQGNPVGQPAGLPTQPPLQGLPTHIPPGGPDCLPGCGYSGLPCYNCSLRPVPQPSQANTPLTDTIPPNANPSVTFAPHVFTVELQDGMGGSGPSNTRDPDQVIVQGDEGYRNQCWRYLSILISILLVKVVVMIFKFMY